MRISGEMAGMMGKQGGQNASPLTGRNSAAARNVVGWSRSPYPPATFRALHVTTRMAARCGRRADVPSDS